MSLGSLMAKNKKIYHRNDMRMALSELSLPPRRILWLILAQLDKDENGDICYVKDRVFTITAKDYAELCKIDESVAYKQLKSGVEEIRSHLMRIPESEIFSLEEIKQRNRPEDGIILFTVANYCYYTDGKGYIQIQLDNVMAPFISKLKNNFTGQFLLSALRLPDSNANKLYLLLREWISSGMMIHKDIFLNDLKERLGVENTNTYASYNSFNFLFFNRAVNKIIKSTEFTTIKMEIIERKSRKASKVRISYEYEGQKRDMKNAGFLLGKEKKDSIKNDKLITKKDDEIKNKDCIDDGLKQVNGRFYDKKTAIASGFNWDDL